MQEIEEQCKYTALQFLPYTTCIQPKFSLIVYS